MKKSNLIILLSLFAASLIVGCKDKTTSKMDKKSVPEVVEESEITEVPDASDIYFDAALEYFKEGNNLKCSEEILKGTKSAREEVKEQDGKLSDGMESRLAALDDLAGKVKMGKVKNVEELLSKFYNLEMYDAHDYFELSEVYLLQEPPRKTASALKNASRRIKAANKYANEVLKEEITKILDKTEKLSQKSEQQLKSEAASVKKEINEIKEKLKELEAKL